MKKIFTFLILIVLIVGICGCSKKANLKDGENSLITFKDSKLNITTNDLYDILKEKYGINTLIDMLDTKILEKEIPDSDEIDGYVDTQVASLKNYYQDEQSFLEYINNYGYQNEDELREYFKLNYKRNLAVYNYLEENISDEEIQNYYNNKIMGDITGSHILIEVETSDSMTEEESRTAKEEGLNKANEAIQKLKDGSSFEDVAKEYSTDEATKDNGGKMGTFSATTLDDVTRQAYEKLEVGKYSEEPVETEYGYEIFYKEKEAEKPKLEDVKTYIIKTLSDEKLSTDSTLQYKGLMALRDKYGFKINDEDLKIYYENTMNNLLNGANDN